MLEVYEIRIDEFERMLRNQTLVCPDWASSRIDKLEQLIDDNGVAYVIVGKDMFFNNAYSMAPSIIAVNDIDGIASSASALEPEIYVGDKLFTKVFCYELWRVRDLTADEEYNEYGWDEEAAEDIEYERCLDIVREFDIYDENGNYHKAYENARNYIADYESKYRIGRDNALDKDDFCREFDRMLYYDILPDDLLAIQRYERACDVLEKSDDSPETVSALEYVSAFERSYDIVRDLCSFYPVTTFKRKDYALDLEELRLAGCVENG